MNKSEFKHDGYYPPWLTDQAVGDKYKEDLVIKYNDFFKEKDKDEKLKKLKELKVYLTVVSDIIAYRYLVKHYTSLFYRLNITIEEYMDYKVERMYSTIRDKKEQINDILSYIYMSFMLSSPRLIYDYSEKVGRCKLVREILPYFQIQRLKFFFIEREDTVEHIIYNVENIELDADSNTEAIRSNLEKYSLQAYNTKQSIINSSSSFDKVKDYIDTNIDFKCNNSKLYLLDLFSKWKSEIESDFQYIKQIYDIKDGCTFSLVDYVRYKYENHQIKLNYEEYIDVLRALNILLKIKEKVY